MRRWMSPRDVEGNSCLYVHEIVDKSLVDGIFSLWTGASLMIQMNSSNVKKPG